MGAFTHYGALVLTPTADPAVFTISGHTTYVAANGDKLFASLEGTLNLATGAELFGGPTTVNHQSVAVDKSALCFVSEKRDRFRNVVWRGKAPHRHAIHNVCIYVESRHLRGVIHIGFYPTRTHSVYANTLSAPFCRQRSRQSDQTLTFDVFPQPRVAPAQGDQVSRQVKVVDFIQTQVAIL